MCERGTAEGKKGSATEKERDASQCPREQSPDVTCEDVVASTSERGGLGKQDTTATKRGSHLVRRQ